MTGKEELQILEERIWQRTQQAKVLLQMQLISHGRILERQIEYLLNKADLDRGHLDIKLDLLRIELAEVSKQIGEL